MGSHTDTSLTVKTISFVIKGVITSRIKWSGAKAIIYLTI